MFKNEFVYSRKSTNYTRSVSEVGFICILHPPEDEEKLKIWATISLGKKYDSNRKRTTGTHLEEDYDILLQKFTDPDYFKCYNRPTYLPPKKVG